MGVYYVDGEFCTYLRGVGPEILPPSGGGEEQLPGFILASTPSTLHVCIGGGGIEAPNYFGHLYTRAAALPCLSGAYCCVDLCSSVVFSGDYLLYFLSFLAIIGRT